jgi:F-type H+-transporting ATPase subunit delta
MGSATRGALAASVSALEDAKGVTLATAEQLLQVARALDGSAQLRGLLADPAIPADDKATIVSRVFPGLEPVAATVLAAAVDGRWSSQADLVAGVEEVGIRAAAHSAKTAKIEAELFEFSRAVRSDHELELAIGSKLGDPAAKAELVDRLFAGKAHDATLAILRHLVQSPRGRRVGELLSDAADIVASSSERIVVTVTSATALSAAQEKRLTAAIAQRYGRTPQLNVVLDPALIGGFRVQVADDVIDGSIASRLQDLRIQLAG